jgi:hypothetical protein
MREKDGEGRWRPVGEGVTARLVGGASANGLTALAARRLGRI